MDDMDLILHVLLVVFDHFYNLCTDMWRHSFSQNDGEIVSIFFLFTWMHFEVGEE